MNIEEKSVILSDYMRKRGWFKSHQMMVHPGIKSSDDGIVFNCETFHYWNELLIKQNGIKEFKNDLLIKYFLEVIREKLPSLKGTKIMFDIEY